LKENKEKVRKKESGVGVSGCVKRTEKGEINQVWLKGDSWGDRGAKKNNKKKKGC